MRREPMKFKFRTLVRVVKNPSVILRPNQTEQTQSEFFEGTQGVVIRHDEAKGGYLVVLDCPELSGSLGEAITAYFHESELDPVGIASPDTFGDKANSLFKHKAANSLFKHKAKRKPFADTPDQAKPGPFEFPKAGLIT